MDYDANGNLIKVLEPMGGATQYVYNSLNRLEKSIDALGFDTTYEYDKLGRVIANIDPRGNKTAYEYNKHSKITKVTDAMNGVTQFNYDLNDNLLTKTDAAGSKHKFTYDSVHRLTSVADPEEYIRNFVYDSLGNLTREYDNAGNIKDYSYDKMHRLLSEKNTAGHITSYKYNDYGNLAEVEQPNGNVYAYKYDILDRITELKDPEGKVTALDYDVLGNLTKAVKPGNREYKFTYDTANNLKTETNPLGETTSYEYNKNNLLSSITNPLKNTTSFTYNPVNQLEKVINPLGHTTTYNYDGNRNLVSEKDGNGYETVYTYDPLNRLSKVTDPLGSVTNYKYDAVGNMTSMANGNGNATKYTYDKRGLLTSIQNPLGETEKLQYSKSGNLLSYTKPDGSKINYSYDVLNRVTGKAYIGSDGKEGENKVNYEYNLMGSRTYMSGAEGETGYAYDMMERLIGVNFQTGEEVSYEYDELGRKSKIIYPDGKFVVYGYDQLDRISYVEDYEGKRTFYKYDEAGRRIETILPNGTKTTYAYDEADRLIKLENTFLNGTVISSFKYEYDKAGNIIKEIQVQEDSTYIRNYKYNSAEEIIEFTEEKDGITKKYSYGYDAAGNRTKMQITGGDDSKNITYSYNEADELITEKSDENLIKYEYDTNGSMTKRILPGNQIEYYDYDEEGRLIQITYHQGKIETFGYDSDGNRTYKTVGEYFISQSPLNSEDAKDNKQIKEKDNKKDNKKENKPEPKEEAKGLEKQNNPKPPKPEEAGNNGNGNGNGNSNGGNDNSGGNNGNGNGNSSDNNGNSGNGNKDNGNDNSNGNNGKGNENSNGEEKNNNGGGNGKGNNGDKGNNQDKGNGKDKEHDNGKDKVKDNDNGKHKGWDKDKVKDGNKGKHLGWYKKADHPKNHGDGEDPILNKPDAYEIINYVNDINNEYTQTLMTSDKNGVYRGVYTYGQERISVRDLVEVEGVPNNPLYYLYDGRGSVTQLTNSVGNVRDKYRYTPFGVPMSGGKLSPNTKLLNNPYGYNGEYHDLESGFQYLRARYYNPETARFITRDSYLGDINEPLSLNRYAYTENNPVMNIDPSGHKPINAYDDDGSGIPKITPKKVATNNQPTLRKGSTDSKGVTKLQQMMVTLGYDLKIDGKFGDKTKAAVIDFQKKNKLSQDGIVGTNTWTALNTVYGNATNTGINPGAMGMTITSNNYVSKKEKQKTSYNNKNCYGGEKIGSSNSFIKEAGSITASFIPILGDAKDVQETVTGKDLITGEKLTKGQRVVTGVMMLLPIANGKAARETIETVADSPIGKGIAKGADEVAERAKKVLDDVICFTGETLIASKYGYKFIKDIEVGDEVYSENPETGEKGLKKVKNIYVNETKELIHISIGETKIKATPSHPFWIIGKGWIAAEKVNVGDKVKLSSGEEVEVTKVEKEILKEAVKVYNFEVEDWHTYYVSDKDVLVHNTCKADPKDAIKGSVEAIGQVHHILTNKTMKALDDHPTLKGKFNREDPMFKYKAADVDAHKGYQQWHRDVDNTVVDWLQNNPKATEQQFKNFLNKLYQNPDISKRIPNVNIK